MRADGRDYPRVRGADAAEQRCIGADRPGTIPACAGPTGRADAAGPAYGGTIPACAGPTLVDLGFYPANE